ncbi:MAG: VaFE repeat-containing surface-anchored protein, partial [Eubacterium sp.]|nr:VaFE repeat-containing surface-anchored protein [Eubacterium sp.]
TYYVKEISAPVNGTYQLDNTVYEEKTTELGKIVPVKAVEKPYVDSLEIVIEKKGGIAGGRSLEGAEFTVRFYKGIYAKDSLPAKADRTWVIRTKKEADGTFAARLADAYKVSGDSFYTMDGKTVLPIGTVTVEETKAPEGYLNDGVITNGSASEYGVYAANTRKEGNGVKLYCGGTMIHENGFSAKDTPVTGGVKIYKRDNETGRNDPQGDAVLSGAKFEIISRNGYNVEVGGKVFASGEVVKTITTDDKGFAATGMHDLPYGDYTVREANGGAPTGYLGKGVLSRDFSIVKDGKMVDMTASENSIRNNVKRGGVEIQKVDNDWMKAAAQGDATLAGAKFDIVSRNKETVLVGGKEFKNGETVMQIATGSDGKAATGSRDLPYGTYEIHEAAPSAGYLINGKWSKIFRIRKDGEIISLIAEPCTEHVIRGGVRMQKKDLELNKAEALGGASLAGIEFQITNRSKQAVRVGGKDYEPGKAVAFIYTDKDGVAETAADALPYGTYTIQEMASDDLGISANDSYLLTDGKAYTFQIREDGKIVNVGTDGKALEVKDQVKRNNVSFRKVEAGTDHSLGMIPFVITNATTHEQHVVVTDKNGKWNSGRYAHTRKTNSCDGLLEKYADGQVIPESELSYQFGTWFGLGQKGSVTEVNDSLPAFPYGTYTITELPCENNEGYELIRNYTFTVEEDHSETHEEPVDLYNLHNTPTTPEISTSVFDSETGDKISLANDDVKITDVVKAVKLQKKHAYILKATLMDQETGNAVRTENADGSRVTVTGSVKFTADQSSMEIRVPMEFNAAKMSGKSVVVFEKLYRVEENGTEILAAEHTSLDDRNQTLQIPSIHTTAVDGQTGDAVGQIGKHAEIIDKVAYTNLIPDRKYTINGILMDQATGKPFLLDDGKPVTAEITFAPKTADGTEEMKYQFSSLGLEGKKLVVFETISLGGKEIAVHKDIHDIGQTVSYLDLHTHAADGQTKEQTGTVGKTTLVDTVSFKNLVIGKEYTITGTLMDKATAQELKDAEGNVITASKTFTAQAENGEQQLTFTFDSSLLEGKDLVAFEKITHQRIDVAAHADISDEAQTVHYPEIHTSAADRKTGSNTAKASEKTVLIDTVTYKNLLPETEYTLKGVLMDQASGSAVKIGGREIAAEATFTTGKAADGKATADGTAEVKFSFDAREIAGTTTVVFEKLYRGDQEIARHEDLTDQGQTVYFPAIHTSASADGAKEAEAKKDITITDTVSYKGLTAGHTYTVKGRLMDKASGKELTVNGQSITGSISFTAKAESGTVDVKFSLDGTGLGGKTLVVFENLYEGEQEIAEHADINDEAQAVAIRQPQKPTPTPTPTPKTTVTTAKTPKTGDTSNMVLYSIILAAAGTVLVAVLKKRKSSR